MSQSKTNFDADAVKETHKRVSRKAIKAPQVLNEAYVYARPSSFSRGLRLDIKGVTILLISGTASIDEHGQTIHEGDFRAQTWRTYQNITALLESRAQPGKTLFEPLAICVTSSATMQPSMRFAPNSSRSRVSIHFPHPRGFRLSCAGPIC